MTGVAFVRRGYVLGQLTGGCDVVVAGRTASLYFQVIYPCNRYKSYRAMAALAALGYRYVARRLPGGADPAGLRVAAVAFIRRTSKYAVYMTPFAFDQSMRALESKPGGEVIKSRLSLRARRIKWQQQYKYHAEHREKQGHNKSGRSSHYLSPI